MALVLTADWEEACTEVRRFRDGRGRGMDEQIIEIVAALNLLGIPTQQSCEGHLDHGYPYPWVSIQCDPSPQFERDILAIRALEQHARQCGTLDAYDAWFVADMRWRVAEAQYNQDDSLYMRLFTLVNDFYAAQYTGDTPARLFVDRCHPGLYRLKPSFGLSTKEIPAALKASYLVRGQEEMQRFTIYLKQQYQAK